MIAGRDAPTHGEAKNSWLTGTAAWNYVAITQWILGLRPTFDGLCIDPCIPPGWDGFSATRVFRGQSVHISVHNPEHVCKGVVRMRINGQEAPGNLIPSGLADRELHVDVWLGPGA
jgi:cellobiose phosphorylase